MSPEIAAIIQEGLDWIENHLEETITPEMLSRSAGFSLYHYCRIFRAATGRSVMAYVTGRRLLHALHRISEGDSMTDAAMAFGFDSYAGFFKAFRRVFGTSPTEHLKNHQAARPARVNLQERGTIMERKQIEAVLGSWGLTGAAVESVCYPNTGNLSATTVLVDGRYELKGSRSPGCLARQAQLLRALHEEGLAAAVIPAQSGGDVVYAGEWEYLLTDRQAGEPLRAEMLMHRPEVGAAVGEGLARLHQALLGMDPLLCREENLTDTLRHWAVPKVKETLPELSGWLDSWLEDFCGLLPALPVQIIHRDPNPDNLRIGDGRITGFADFDLSCIAPRIFDAAYAVTGILSTVFSRMDAAQRQAFFPLARAVWQGYHARSPLTAEELAALPDMVIAIQLICVAAFAGSDAYAHLADVNRQMLEWILANGDQLRRPIA